MFQPIACTRARQLRNHMHEMNFTWQAKIYGVHGQQKGDNNSRGIASQSGSK
jgi:hypothetical protein